MTYLYPTPSSGPVKKAWPLCSSGSGTTLAASPTVIGSTYFDPRQWKVDEAGLTRTVIFRVSFNTTKGTVTAYVRLYDVDGITNGGVPQVVPASLLSTTDTVPDYQTVDLSATLGACIVGGLIEIEVYVAAEDVANACVVGVGELSVSWA